MAYCCWPLLLAARMPCHRPAGRILILVMAGLLLEERLAPTVFRV
eukprot:COSAG01_NODE_48745_length_378_cov_1.114695_1_plen_44_part_10